MTAAEAPSATPERPLRALVAAAVLLEGLSPRIARDGPRDGVLGEVADTDSESTDVDPFDPAVGPTFVIAAGMLLLTMAIGLLTSRDVYKETPMAAIREA